MNRNAIRDVSQTMQLSLKSRAVIVTVLGVMSFITLFPLIMIVSISLSNEVDIINHGFSLIPHKVSTSGYDVIFKRPDKLLNAYKVTLLVTVIGTVLSVLVSSMIAYPLSRRDFIFRRFMSFYLFFVMLFSGGLVPIYILITRYFQLQNTYAVLILMHLVNPFTIFLIRANFQKIPTSLIESAKIDGASEMRIYWRIIIPLSTPVLATVALIVALGYWNDWFTSVLYITNPKLYSLQMLLKVMMEDLSTIRRDMMSQEMLRDIQVPTENLRMAMCLIAIGPIVILFPFLQKYFVQGLTVGSVKG
ncbi:MAG: carbohydrate ABC transporter permease [Spirochaetia bacterium]